MKKIIRNTIRGCAIQFYKLIQMISSTKKNTIVFTCANGTNYTGSPRAIYEKIVEMGLDEKYECYWLFKDLRLGKNIQGKHIPVKIGSIKYMRVMSFSKTWVFDCRIPPFIKKRNDQKFIQIWHGTPLKKLGLDITNDFLLSTGEDIENFKNDFYRSGQSWDYLVAQNDYSSEIFRSCFAFKNEMLKIGYPRNDVLFKKNNEEDIKKIKKQLGIPLDKKTILYAPTYRDNEFDSSGNQTFIPKLDFNQLKSAIGDDTVLLVKYHYWISQHIDWSPYKDFIIHFDNNTDINNLYLVADKLITDYSSVMFDYSLLHKPMYYYCYDLDSYKDEIRGFYFDFINEAPGPISTNVEELIRDLSMDEKEFQKTYSVKQNKFYKKFHGYDDGNASKRIIDLIESF